MGVETALIGACAGLAGAIIGALFQHFLANRRTSQEELRKHSRDAALKLIEKFLELTRKAEPPRRSGGGLPGTRQKATIVAVPGTPRSSRASQLGEIAALQKQLLDPVLRARVSLTVDILTEPAVKEMYQNMGYPSDGVDTIACRYAIECLASYLRGEKEPAETPEYAMCRVTVELVHEQATKYMREEIKRLGENLAQLSEKGRREVAEVHLGLRRPEEVETPVGSQGLYNPVPEQGDGANDGA